MTKKLNVVSITNELEESAFFQLKENLPVSPIQQIVSVAPKSSNMIRPAPEQKSYVPERPNATTDQRPNGKRIITRNSFEIYEDQMDSLRTLSYQEKMEGKMGSMSGMVREAIDSYLVKKTPKK